MTNSNKPKLSPSSLTPPITYSITAIGLFGCGGSNVIPVAPAPVSNTNNTPVITTPIADASTNEDSLYSYDASANFNDIDSGDALTYAAVLSGNVPLPAWLSLNSQTGVFSGTPANGDVGTIDVTLTATDGASASISDTYQITIINTNDAPTGSVRLFGVAENGETIVSDTSILSDEDGLGGFSYQWYADGVAVSNQTAQSLTLTANEIGKNIHAVISYTDGAGNATDVNSVTRNHSNFHMFTGGEDGYISGINPTPFVESYSINGSSSVEQNSVPITASNLHNITSVNATWAREGDSVIRFYGDGSEYGTSNDWSYRVELANSDWSTKFTNGEETYYSSSFYAPSEEWDPVTDYSTVITQYKQYGGGNPNFEIRLSNKGDYKLTTKSHYHFTSTDSEGDTLATITPDTWNDLKIYVKQSKATDGEYKVWLNGELVFSHVGQTMYHSADDGYLKFGMYTEIRDERTLYFDAVELSDHIDVSMDVWATDRNHLPTVSFSGATNNQQIASGSALNLSVTAADPAGDKLYSSGHITQVELLDNATVISTDTSSSFSFDNTLLSDGAHSLRVRATDNDGNTVLSDAVDVWVGNKPATAQMTVPSALVDMNMPASQTLTVSANDPDGAVQSVEFYANNILIGSGAETSVGVYSFDWTPSAAGAYGIFAIAVDNEGKRSASDVVAVAVNDNISTNTIIAAQDASIKESEPTTFTGNWGDNEVYGSPGANIVALIEFDLTSVLNAVEIRSASLNLFADTVASGGEFSLYSTTNTQWDEQNVTWSIAPEKHTIIDSVNITQAGTNAQFDIRDHIESLIDSNQSSVTFWVEASEEGYDKFEFDSVRQDQPNPPNILVESSLYELPDDGFVISSDLL